MHTTIAEGKRNGSGGQIMVPTPSFRPNPGTPMTSVITTRLAGLADVDILWPMIQELHRHEHLPEAGPEVRNALESLLKAPEDGRIILVRSDGLLAGYLTLTFGYSLEFHGKFGLVDELFVGTDYRGQGMGGALLTEAERICQAAGIKVMRLEVEHTNLAAERLYANRGFGRHDRRLMSKW